MQPSRRDARKETRSRKLCRRVVRRRISEVSIHFREFDWSTHLVATRRYTPQPSERPANNYAIPISLVRSWTNQKAQSGSFSGSCDLQKLPLAGKPMRPAWETTNKKSGWRVHVGEK